MNEIYVFIKIFGAILILGGSFLTGINWGQKLEHNYLEYEGIKLVLNHLLRNQNYLRQSFPEVFLECADCLKQSNGAESVVEKETKHLGECLPEVTFDAAWNTYVQRLAVNLKMNENLKNQLRHTGTLLQGMDEEGITLQINHTMEILQEEILHKRNEIREKKKIGLSCSIMVGLFAVIILI